MKLAALIGAALLFPVTCAHANSATGNAAAERQIREALAHWVEAANHGDYKTALAVWAPDLIGWAPVGPDDTYERETKFASMQPQPMTFELKIDEVIVDGSMAVVRDIWTQTNRDSSGTEKVQTYRSFEVWRHQTDGAWKISRWIDGPPMLAGSECTNGLTVDSVTKKRGNYGKRSHNWLGFKHACCSSVFLGRFPRCPEGSRSYQKYRAHRFSF